MRMHSLSSIAIPEDVWWEDEFDWDAISQSTEYSVTGTLVVDQGIRQAGRPITLTSSANGGWVSRGTVMALQAQRDVPEATFTLTLADGRSFTVMHDLSRTFEARPVRPASDMSDASPYRITLPLIEI